MRNLALTQLNIHPIKSCAAIAVERARLTHWGLEHDRSWMVVDAVGTFLSQRRYPSMALVTPAIVGEVLQIRAPGMPLLEVPMSHQEYAQFGTGEVSVWGERLPALDAGPAAADWFTRFLQAPVRLVRFDPQVRRIVSPAWTRELESVTQFSDGFPILVLSEASLEELNSRLLERGRAAVPMLRFRPNVVVSGLQAYEEDGIDLLEFPTSGAVLKLVKPCKRCAITTVDPRTGARDALWPTEPLETLASYRNNAVVHGVAFGQNALIVEGVGALLEVGQTAQCR